MSNVVSGNTIAEVASLIGDPARANMLAALMGGQALTAGQLARRAGVTAQTTSGHMRKLMEAELLAVEKQGRHRYYRLASPDMAHAIHALMTVAAGGPKRHHPVGPKDEALRLARTCYDHMAGRLASALTDALSGKGYIDRTPRCPCRGIAQRMGGRVTFQIPNGGMHLGLRLPDHISDAALAADMARQSYRQRRSCMVSLRSRRLLPAIDIRRPARLPS